MTGGEPSLTDSAYKGSALGASAFAGGKGKGGGAIGKGEGRNFLGPSGRQMECFRCGSRDHLIDKCLVPKGKGKGGGGKTGRYFEDGFWQTGAVDGADYSGCISPKSFLTIPSGEQFPIGDDAPQRQCCRSATSTKATGWKPTMW